MKRFKSIKWRLQLWYGLILIVVLLCFGLTAYRLQRNLLFGSIDGELQRRFAVIASTLHPHPPGPGRPPFGGPPPDEMMDESPPPPGHPPKFQLPPQDSALFDSGDPHQFWFSISDRDGKRIAASANAGRGFEYRDDSHLRGYENTPPDLSGGLPPPEIKNSRFLIRVLPSGELVRVGCSIVPELNDLAATALWLFGAGGIILVFGLAGGWWISSHAIRPVETISATALKISGGDLSHRIDIAETDTELGSLAAVLNSTFERLESAFAQQKQFASDAAHELRTPVSVILTQTQSALSRDREAKDYKQTIEACQRAAQRMRKLIGALLELARLDAGQEPIQRLPFDFSKMIFECVELVQPLAEKRGIRISADTPPLEITADAEKLSLVVTNLLTNAIEYNHAGGDVSVAVRRDRDMTILTVSDTGPGISATDMPKVFERFYRADKSRSSGNAGLGLAISKAIVAAHGGTIEVSSEEKGGAVFTVRLPTVS